MLKLTVAKQIFCFAPHLCVALQLKLHLPNSQQWRPNPSLARTTSSLSSYNIRFVSDKENNLKTHLLNLMACDGWRPGLEDVNCLLAGDPNSLFVGELDGKPIAYRAYLKYHPSYCHGGFYIVEKEYRGKGYGLELCKRAIDTLPPDLNVAGHIISEGMVKKYEEVFGFQGHWIVPRYDVHLLTAFQNLSRLPQNNLYRAQRIHEVDMQDLLDYDASVFGYQRNRFLQTFLKGNQTRVAINKEGAVVGYAVARVGILKEEGYRVGPLYADSLEIAQMLLKALFEDILEMRISSSNSILFDMPSGKNPEATKLAELLDGKFLRNLVFISTKGIPKGRFEKWFGILANFG